MEQKERYVGGTPNQQVDPEQLQKALFDVMKRTAQSGTAALGAFGEIQQRRAARLEGTAKALREKLGEGHPDVLAVEEMARAATEVKEKVGEQTARLKKWPKVRPHEWVVFGTVHDHEGRPAEGLIVRVFDRDRKYDDLLGETETDEHGGFSMIYHERDFKETRENLPELYVMISDAKGALLYSSRDNVRFNSGRSEYFAIRLGAPGRAAKPKAAKTGGDTTVAGRKQD